MRYRFLSDLQPGERFLLPVLGKKGTLVSLSPSSATVDYDAQSKTTTITTRWGETITFKKQGSERAVISRETLVVRLIKHGGNDGTNPE